jgi:hypothetical protein
MTPIVSKGWTLSCTAKATEPDSWRRFKSKAASNMVKGTAKTANRSQKIIIHSPLSRLAGEVALLERAVEDGKLLFSTWID